MSIYLMSQAYRVEGLTTAQKAVLVVLCDHANDDGQSCYPSIPRIARHSSLSERTVYRVLTDLEEAGYIKREAVRGRPSQFTINLSRSGPCQIVTPDMVAEAPDMVAEAPDTVSPEPSITIKEQPRVKSSCDDAFTVKDFEESWNAIADECGLGKIRKLTPARQRAFKVRQREYPDIDDWKAAFRCLRANKWMHGDNKNGWRADPDFFLQAKSFTKLVEGQYDKAD